MREVFWWFLLSCKRFLRRPAFLLLLALFPVSCFAFARAQADTEGTVRVALFAADGADSLADRTVRDLAAETDSIFSFFLCENEEALSDAVAAGRAECGFAFCEDFEGRLSRGEAKRSIRVYTAPSTVADGLAKEAVFSALARRYVKILLADYAGRQSFPADEMTGTSAGAQIETLYGEWLDSGKTFRFVFETADSAGAGTENQKTAAAVSVFPARGLSAVWIFLAALTGTLTLLKDEERGLTGPLRAGTRVPCALACIAAPTVLAAVSALAARTAAGECTPGALPREAAALCVYVLFLLPYCLVLKKLTAGAETLLCLIPLLLTGSLIFCPVFVDVGHFLPGLARLGLMFPPYYYLRFL